jgi:hypothetical protein
MNMAIVILDFRLLKMLSNYELLVNVPVGTVI